MIKDDEPDANFIDLNVIDEITIKVTYNMLGADLETIDVENNMIPPFIEINNSELKNLNLDYIQAITHSLEFPVVESPSVGIPDGFSDVTFMDFIIEIEIFNEIGIDSDIDLDITGTKGFDNVAVPMEGITVPMEATILAPTPINNYGCEFEETGDTARTLIISNRFYQTTEYFCNTTDTVPSVPPDTFYFDASSGSKSFFDLLNFVPDNINIGGSAIIEGEGVFEKASEIWGNFTLESPLSFIFKDKMTIIPADPWPLPAINNPETSKK